MDVNNVMSDWLSGLNEEELGWIECLTMSYIELLKWLNQNRREQELDKLTGMSQITVAQIELAFDWNELKVKRELNGWNQIQLNEF